MAAAQGEGGQGRSDPLGGKARYRGRGGRVGGSLPIFAGGGLPDHHRRGRARSPQGADGRRRNLVGAARQAGARVQGGEAQGLLPLPAAPRSGWSTQGRPRSRKGARSSDQGPRRRGQALMLWATRQGCHVDRRATFAFFGDPAEAPEGAELFDVVGARLSHHGEDCSFETFLKEYDLND